MPASKSATPPKPAVTPSTPARRGRRTLKVSPFSAPADSAKAAALKHVADDCLGIQRKTTAKGTTYVGVDGKPIRNVETLKRIKSLAIPPAWVDVWICAEPDGHLQATGRDARGRKQYRYHPQWAHVRDEAKFGRAVLFGESLAGIRKHVNADLARHGLSRERVLATIVRLLELTFIRVGNAEYARTNKSFGLTTLLDKHVQIAGASVLFKFRGKSGKTHEIKLTDRRLAQLVKRCRDVPGQDLFQYIDASGARHAIRSNDVNEYLREVADHEFTAKDFRTWAGTLLASHALLQDQRAEKKFTKASALRAVETVAARLGNTPAVCRKSYIHPAILKSFEDEALRQQFAHAFSVKKRVAGLGGDESALLRFLKTPDAKAMVSVSIQSTPG